MFLNLLRKVIPKPAEGWGLLNEVLTTLQKRISKTILDREKTTEHGCSSLQLSCRLFITCLI